MNFTPLDLDFNFIGTNNGLLTILIIPIFQVDAFRRDVENLRQELEESEEINLKQKRELNDLRNSHDSLQSEVTKLQKSKRRLQNEVDQMNAIFDAEKNEIAEAEAKIKKLNKVSEFSMLLFCFVLNNLKVYCFIYILQCLFNVFKKLCFPRISILPQSLKSKLFHVNTVYGINENKTFRKRKNI